MAKGQHLSGYQRGIVKRYYENRDSIMATKLGELVSELYLAEGKKASGLWTRVETALTAMKVEPKRIERVVGAKDLEGLARLVGELS
jgi:hypothetical protein